MYTSTITRSALSGVGAAPGAAARTECPSALSHSMRSSRMSLSCSMMTILDMAGSGMRLFVADDCDVSLHRSGPTPSFPIHEPAVTDVAGFGLEAPEWGQVARRTWASDDRPSAPALANRTTLQYKVSTGVSKM